MFKIDTDHPLPDTRKKRKHGKYPFADMVPGDSFFVPGTAAKNVGASASGWGYRRGQKFTTRTVTEDGVPGVRVWRVS